MEYSHLQGGPAVSVASHTSPEASFWVNSYVIDTPEGLIVIDTQFTVTEAGKLLELARAANKPLLAVLITHPHPDHVNGTGTLLTGLNSAPVVATQSTRDGVAALAEPKRAQWKPILGDDYPDGTVLPGHIVADGGTVAFGGVTFRFRDVGPAESLNESVIEVPDYGIAFVGDLFYHGAHPWLVEGRSAQWLTVLEAASGAYGSYRALLPGHGLPGDPSAITTQAEYIARFRDLVRAGLGVDGTVSEEGHARIKEALDASHPGWALTGLHDMNITGVAAELAAHRQEEAS